MIVGPIGVGIILLVSTGWWRSQKRVHPAHQARLLAVGLLSGGILIQAGLWLWASPVVLDAVGRPDLAAACEAMFGGSAPGGRIGGIAALGAAIWLAMKATCAAVGIWREQRRYRVEWPLGVASHHPTHDLVILPLAQPIAYTVGGRPPQVVLSQGIVDRLPGECVDAITAHEVIHARHRHHRYLMLASALGAAAGWLPPVRTGIDHLKFALERWADEGSAHLAPQGRQGVRTALLAMATTMVYPPAAVPAFGGADTIRARLHALNGEAPTAGGGRLVAAYGAAGVLLMATMATAGWAGHGLAATVAELSRCCHV